MSRHALADVKCPRDPDHNVSDYELDLCLREGSVLTKPTFDEEHQAWKYQMQKQFDTHLTLAITAIINEESIRVITRFKKKTQYNKAKPKAPGKK